jgi:hypothetical protein
LAEIARERGIRPDQIETWFADEARIGQKNKLTRRWANPVEWLHPNEIVDFAAS